MTLERFQHHSPTIGKHCYLHPSAVIIGQVTLGDDVSVWPHVTIRGDVEAISIGEKTNIQDGSVLHVTHYGPHNDRGYPLHIGHSVTVGHQATLHACTIGDTCLIGMNAIILDDAVVEPLTMIGAGSLIPPGKTVTGGHLWVGRPAKPVRRLTEEEMAFLSYSAEHYVHLKNQYLNTP